MDYIAIQPENKQYNTIAEIKVSDDMVTVYYPRNDEFYSIVKKQLNYTWSGSEWYKEISYKTGSAAERAAELGNRLLNTGFPIMILDPEIRRKAIKADYEPEHHRWIARRISGDYEDWFSISWTRDNDMYHEARRLPQSRYSSPDVVVKAEYYIEIQEFAELYDFRFSPGAKELIKEARERERTIQENTITVNPAEPKEVEHKNGLREILESSGEILEDLKDD